MQSMEAEASASDPFFVPEKRTDQDDKMQGLDVTGASISSAQENGVLETSNIQLLCMRQQHAEVSNL